MMLCVITKKKKKKRKAIKKEKHSKQVQALESARIGLNTTEVYKVPNPQPDQSWQQSDL